MGITGVQRSILCDPYAVAMRTGARLPSAEFALLSRSGSTSRALNSERLLWAEFFCHTKPPRTKGSSIRPSSEKPIWTGLRPPDNGHRPILQKGADESAVYLQAVVVADEAFLLERIHKFAYPCAGCTNHFREGCLAHLQGVLWL